MKDRDIQPGGLYVAKVGEKLTVVKVIGKRGTGWQVTNEGTDRDTYFRSAAKFRRVATDRDIAFYVTKRKAAAKQARIHRGKTPPADAKPAVVKPDPEMFALGGVELLERVTAGGPDAKRAQAELDRRLAKRQAKKAGAVT